MRRRLVLAIASVPIVFLVAVVPSAGAGARSGAQAPSIPTHDRDVFSYAAGGVALLIVGAALIVLANRRRR